MDGMTVLWIVVVVVVVLILAAFAAKKPKPGYDEQTASANGPQADALEPDAAPSLDPVRSDTASSAEPGATARVESVRASTPHTATWGGVQEAPAPVRTGDVESADASVPSDAVVDEEGDGCPADMDSEHFGGIVEGTRPD